MRDSLGVQLGLGIPLEYSWDWGFPWGAAAPGFAHHSTSSALVPQAAPAQVDSKPSTARSCSPAQGDPQGSLPQQPLPRPPTHELKPIPADFTFQILRVVNDKVPVPHHSKVHCQVADVHPIIEVLQGETAVKCHSHTKRVYSERNHLHSLLNNICWCLRHHIFMLSLL